VRFYALRTRQAGSRAFISVHVRVPAPGTWSAATTSSRTSRHGLRERLPYATVFTRVKLAEDPGSFADARL
jgi:divalent metal cation (Fe/Co/Zn/Cd) transporter